MIKYGKILGINDRYYLLDGIWLRCSCGCSVLEIIKVRWCDEEEPNFQIRCFNPAILKKHIKNSCIVLNKVGIGMLLDILTCYDVCKCVDAETKCCLKAVVDDDGDLNIALYTPDEKKEIWAFLLDSNDVRYFGDELKRLLDIKGDQNGLS